MLLPSSTTRSVRNVGHRNVCQVATFFGPPPIAQGAAQGWD
jgi:hypothetical protein